MKAKLYAITSPDVVDLENYSPEDPLVFGLLVDAYIGPDDGLGYESFSFLVKSPRFIETRELNNEWANDEYLFARHYLILHRYSYEILWRAISSLCDNAQGPNWHTIAQYLARFGQWEFEDYQESIK